MYRIDVPTAVAVKPAYPAGAAGGFFANCNPSEGFPGTTLDAYFLNRVQEEICHVITGAGIALNAANDNQLLLAIQALILGAVPLLPDFGVRPVVSTAVNHTVNATTQKNAYIEFTAGGKDCILPASAGNLGFPLTIKNKSATGLVRLVPNGSDTVDGFADRSLGPEDEVDIINIGGTWRTLKGVYSYTTPPQTFVIETGYTFAHGLREKPTRIDAWMENITTEFGWQPGDRIWVDGVALGWQYSTALAATATSLVMSTQRLYVPFIPAKSGGASGPNYITPSKWAIYLTAKVEK